MNNERRADLGAAAIAVAATATNVIDTDTIETSVTDVLAYIAHFCDRAGLDPSFTFDRAIGSYIGDFEDGPAAEKRVDGTEAFWTDLTEGAKP